MARTRRVRGNLIIKGEIASLCSRCPFLSPNYLIDLIIVFSLIEEFGEINDSVYLLFKRGFYYSK